MDTEELIRKVRKVQIVASHLVSDTLAGNYVSAFRGTGMEFDEVREYQPGDDVRTIDWNVTARAAHPHVKRFTEERELTAMILVDGSSSVGFGSEGRTKLDLASEISAVLAFSAIANNDKVGLILFTDRVDLYLPPDKGKSHVLRVIREILSFKPRQARTDIKAALDFLARVRKRRTLAFLVSDFYDQELDQSLDTVGRRHDLVAVRITDRREEELPPLGLVRLEDAETGEQVLVDTASAAVRRLFTRQAETLTAGLKQSLNRHELDTVALRTGDDYLMPLKRLFKEREKRRR